MKNRLISLKRIIDNDFGDDIATKNRKRNYTYARAVYCKVAREMNDIRPYSLMEIGEVINRDHATVLHSINVVFPFAIQESSFKLLYLTLKSMFVDNKKSAESFDDMKSLGERIIEVEKDNHLLRQKIEIMKHRSNRFDKMLEGLNEEELDEVHYKMEIFVKSIKSRVYL
jgi:hypothetical protein